MDFQFNDGGRAAAGYKGEVGDCVVRSIAIITGKPYQEVYDDLHLLCRNSRRARARGKTTPRNGVHRTVYEPYLKKLGYRWVPTMGIGTGCMVHLNLCEAPLGRAIVRVSKHMTAVIDGVIHDLEDCSRNGTRCVYGYFTKDNP